MSARLHAAAGLLAMACIAAFLAATLVAELFLGGDAVASVKRGIVQGLALLVPALALTGASGFSLARRRRGALVERKARRMRLIAANGLLILVPAAFYLRHKAGLGEWDAAFITVQCLEMAAGGANLCLMALNARDGLRLGGRQMMHARDGRSG